MTRLPSRNPNHNYDGEGQLALVYQKTALASVLPTPAFFATRTPTPTFSPDFFLTPTPTVTPTPSPTPVSYRYAQKEWPRGWIAPQVLGDLSFETHHYPAIKVFGCEMVSNTHYIAPPSQVVVGRIFGGEDLLSPEIPTAVAAKIMAQRISDTFEGCWSVIDAIEIFNEASGDGNEYNQKRVAEISYLVAQWLVSRGVRPVVFNYPVGAPTKKDAFLPETIRLLKYVASVDGFVGVHLYFPCNNPQFPATWNFTEWDKEYRRMGIHLKYVATEAGICKLENNGHWNPYVGWRECPSLEPEEYKKQLRVLLDIARGRVDMVGLFVFVINIPGDKWASFDARPIFP